MLSSRVWALAVLVCFCASPLAAQRGGMTLRCSIRGKVLYRDNMAPAERVRVNLVDGQSYNVIKQTTTDAVGQFEFHDLVRDMAFLVEVNEEGYQPVRVGADFSYACPADVVIFLQPISGDAARLTHGAVSVEELQIPGKARKAFAAGLRALEEEKRPALSVPHFRQAIALHAGYSEAYVQLSRAHIYQAEYGDAQRVLEQAVARNPKNLRAYALLGVVYRHQGESARAREALERAVELDNDSWLAHYELGNTLLAAGDYEDAYPHAQQAHRLNPDAVSTHVLLYNLCVLRRDFSAALAELDEFLTRHPQSSWAPQALRLRGQLRQALPPSP